MKKLLWAFAVAAVAAPSALADMPRIDGIEKITSSRVDSAYVLMMDVNASAVKPGRDRELMLTPVLRATDGSDSIALPGVVIAGRNRYFSHLRNKNLPAGDKMLRGGSSEVYNYRFTTPWQPWMNQSEVIFTTTCATCCEAPKPVATTPAVRHDYRQPRLEYPVMNVALTGDSAITVEAKGSAFVDFVVNRTELKPDYRGNRAEIEKILKSIDLVANDPEAIITAITIKGYASPEGPYSNNVRLAMGRTNTLKEYVQAECERRGYGLSSGVIGYDYEPEDWDGLIAWLENNEIANRDAILAIARDTSLEPDPRNTKIQTMYPEQYAFLLKEVYPALRHSDYTIRYNIKTGIDVVRLKEMFEVTPERLRPVDFYLVARTYPEGSPEWQRVMLKAADVYPDDEEAAINAANIYMTLGDMEAAAPYIAKVGKTPAGLFTKANYAARRGDLYQAQALLQSAAGQGYEAAEAALEEVNALIARDPVEYLIER
ncbi:MAG: DUF3868 domain-containing protein [Duncaniella sp.]|nr:DUF3868 domain-containing protein [Duncaniella sp.]